MTQEKADNTLLIIDDDEQVLKSIESLLDGTGYNILRATGSKEGVEMIMKKKPPVVLTDLKMEQRHSGIQVLEEAKRRDPDVVVILYTAHGDISVTRDAFKKGAFDFIQKVQTHQDIIIPIERAFKFAHIKRENNYLKSKLDFEQDTGFHGAVGRSPVMLELFNQVKRVAQTNANVLVTGETGTGKEIIARGIHHYSQRKNAPFVPVVVSTLPDNLLEGELFGHVKGAFTGAVSDKPGLFEAANKGTIFLDEIGEVPIDMQPKLLRVLQERRVRRLGSLKERDLDVRIISATNADPDDLVKEGKLREDLFFRLNVVRIALPPLRERREDISVLAYHFLKIYQDIGLVKVEKISNEALMLMEEYDWPGNVRQLQNAIESAIAVATKEEILPENLPDPLRPKSNRVMIDTNESTDFKSAKAKVRAGL
ncbi:MAG: sigma-54 dependent transcriptional regulator [candidate division KSB1 bacterium]|nr:sigma-54 dependent transcriptional regulator [candidate division KSB1 bacterium]